jgi:hypothetical protein
LVALNSIFNVFITLGKHLTLHRQGDVSEFPCRKKLLMRLNREWKKDLNCNTEAAPFNAIQSNIYSGGGVCYMDDGNEATTTPDHITFHKDGRCKKRGPPIVSACYSNVPPPANNTKADPIVAFLICHQEPAVGVRVWIPQISQTGYAFGGRCCHKKYYHGKYLFGEWKPYHHHVSITFSSYQPVQLDIERLNTTKERGVLVDPDWKLVDHCHLWRKRYLLCFIYLYCIFIN